MKMRKRACVAGAFCLGLTLSVGATTWTYTPGKENPNIIGTVTDGQWTLKVTGFDKKNGVLRFASNWGKSIIKDWTEPTDSASRGVLDLRSPLKISENGQETTITNVVAGGSAFSWSTNLVAFSCDMLTFHGADNSQFAGNANLTRIEIGGGADSLPNLLLNKNPKLKTVKFDFPALRSVYGIFGNETSPDPIDVGTIAVPAVTNIADWSLNRKCVAGDLVLTNIAVMGAGTFSGASLTNVFLGGPLTQLGENVFKGSTVTNIVLDLPELAAAAKSSFGEQRYIRSVEFRRTPAGGMGLATNIIAHAAWGNNNLGSNGYLIDGSWRPNNLRIYVSKKQWTPEETEVYDATNNPTGFFLGRETFTKKEKEMIQGDSTLGKAFGVCVRVANGKLVRQAFFVHKPSPHDPKGFALPFR